MSASDRNRAASKYVYIYDEVSLSQELISS